MTKTTDVEIEEIESSWAAFDKAEVTLEKVRVYNESLAALKKARATEKVAWLAFDKVSAACSEVGVTLDEAEKAEQTAWENFIKAKEDVKHSLQSKVNKT